MIMFKNKGLKIIISQLLGSESLDSFSYKMHMPEKSCNA
jgi:hypothetical protein